MSYKQLAQGISLAVNEGTEPLITDENSALDLMANARYQNDCDALVIMKEDITEDFFDLSTRIAGEVLQKFVNYSMKVGIVGDFSGHTSKSLRDFIRESNQGNSVCFVDTVEEAVAKLGK